jgi:hypothetical protein
MSNYIEIYNTKILLPTQPPIEEIENWGFPNSHKDQYWRRLELPSFFNSVEFDKDGNALLDKRQSDFAREEVRRCKEGFWFFNNGTPTYITGKNYFYLKYWKLEDDIFPDYRDLDRRYFLFLNHWENVPTCLGILIGKKRRQGATSIATSNLIYECVFFKNSNCGFTSKTLLDAKSAFTNMISFGYRQLPVFLKPKQLNNKDSVTELVFAHKSVEIKGKTGSVIDNDTGHRSRIDYRAPSPNVYDSGRLSRLCIDEGAKLPKEVPFSTLVSIVSKTLVKGVKRVGFMECPSTTNAMSNGGEEFKKVWDNSNQFKHERTPTRLVKYVTPAYDGYMGFIDRYGISVIDEPTEEQYKYLVENFVGIGDLTEEDVKGGAKKYLENKRKLLTGSDLEEAIRMEPFNEEEMFMYAGNGCEYNAENFKNQIRELEENPVYIRQCRLVSKKEKIPKKFPTDKEKEREVIGFMDDAKGGWFLLEEPIKPNDYKEFGGYLEPKVESPYIIGCDTTQDRIAIHGSNPAICVFKKSVIIDGEETGMYPVALWISPTRLDIHFDEEVRKACLWYSAKANYEVDRRTDYWRHFCKNNSQAFLQWTPKVLQNPLKRNFRLEYGSRSGDPFQLQQMLEISKYYADGTDNEVYNGHVHRIKFIQLLKQGLEYNHSDRTKSDLWVSLQMALVAVFGETQVVKTDFKKQQVLPTYKINLAV